MYTDAMTPYRFSAPPARRKTSLPALHRRRPNASEGRGHDTDHPEIALSRVKAAEEPPTAIVDPLPTTPASGSLTEDTARLTPHRRHTARPAPAGSFPGGFRMPALSTGG